MKKPDLDIQKIRLPILRWGYQLRNSITAKPIVKVSFYGHSKASHSDKWLWYEFRAGNHSTQDLSELSQRKNGKLNLISKPKKFDTLAIFFSMYKISETSHSHTWNEANISGRNTCRKLILPTPYLCIMYFKWTYPDRRFSLENVTHNWENGFGHPRPVNRQRLLVPKQHNGVESRFVRRDEIHHRVKGDVHYRVRTLE